MQIYQALPAILCLMRQKILKVTNQVGVGIKLSLFASTSGLRAIY